MGTLTVAEGGTRYDWSTTLFCSFKPISAASAADSVMGESMTATKAQAYCVPLLQLAAVFLVGMASLLPYMTAFT